MTTAGYKQDRDEHGLTKRERAVKVMLCAGWSYSAVGNSLDLTRQRIGQIAKSLEAKGAIRRLEDGGWVEGENRG